MQTMSNGCVFLTLTFLLYNPSGSFFSDYSITIFGINLAIFHASNRNFNILINN